MEQNDVAVTVCMATCRYRCGNATAALSVGYNASDVW